MDELQMIFVSSLIGVCTGAIVVALNNGVHGLADLVKEVGAERGTKVGPFLWAPLLGGALVSASYAAFGGVSGLEGTDLPIVKTLAVEGGPGSAVDELGGLSRIERGKRFVGRTAFAAVTLGTGNSLGPEGPSVEIGANVAAFLGDFGSTAWPASKASRDLRLQLLATGCAAGVAAGFNAPLAGLFFAVEVIKPPRSTDDIVPRLLATALAATVVQIGLGSSPAVKGIDFVSTAYVELPVFMLLGAFCGAASALFASARNGANSAFEWLQAKGVPRFLHPLLASGLVALACGFGGFTELLYQGFDNVNALFLFADEYSPLRLLLLLVVKIVLTAVCAGSGLVGGVFAPALFMGACGGALYGQLAGEAAHALGIALSPATDYAAVGGAAALASICNVPVTAVVLLLELTAGTDYSISLPLIAAISLAVWTDQFLERGGKLRGFGIKDVTNEALTRVSMLSAKDAPDTSRIFDSMEKNKDGTVTRKEFQDWISKLGVKLGEEKTEM